MNPKPQLEARHRPSGLNSRFEGDGLSFAEYVARTRDMLRRARGIQDTANLEQIIDGNAPFELKPAAGFQTGRDKPYRRGVLLVHGLTDSPYFMRYLAAFFAENGFRVMAVLLPGHGTRPGDLLEIAWQEWGRTVAYGADRLAEEADEIYLAGYSAGATLSVLQNLRDDRVCGLFLFSPALQISPRAAYANLHKAYSWLLPSAAWLEIKPDSDLYKYESFPKNAAARMHGLIRELDRELARQLRHHAPNIPVFAAASADDVTVNVSATLEFMAHASHPISKLVLYTTDTARFSPNISASNISAKKLEPVNSRVPGQNIISSAHTAIVLSPDDAHYGANGDYSNCTHYYPRDMEKYAACRQHPERDLQGELTEENLKAGVLRRLMYNPNFSALKISMRQFIDRLP